MTDTVEGRLAEAREGAPALKADLTTFTGRRLLAQLEDVLEDASSRLGACLRLVRLDTGDGVPQQRARETVEPLDAPSRAQYRQRLRALDGRVARARAAGDAAAESQALAEREALFAGLSQALGLRRSSLAPIPDVALVDGGTTSPAG